MARESDIVKTIIHWIQTQPGGKAIKVHGNEYMELGTPDIIGGFTLPCGPVPVAFEVKKPGNVARKLQEYRLRQWRGAGFCAHQVESLEDVIAHVGDFIEEVYPDYD
jgi:hypothetical protein